MTDYDYTKTIINILKINHMMYNGVGKAMVGLKPNPIVDEFIRDIYEMKVLKHVSYDIFSSNDILRQESLRVPLIQTIADGTMMPKLFVDHVPIDIFFSYRE